MFRLAILIAGVIAVASPRIALAQGGPGATSAEPFKVGTFEIRGVPVVGLVLRDALIVDIQAANATLERSPMYPKLPMPADMLELIGRYEYGVKARLYEIVNDLVRNNRLTAKPRPDYVHDLASVRTLAPILYPSKIMNAAVNFYSHVNETGTPEQISTARRQRREQRGVPYLFLKPSRGAVIGNGEAVVLPHGRDRIDWEVELGTVIGRAAIRARARRRRRHAERARRQQSSGRLAGRRIELTHAHLRALGSPSGLRDRAQHAARDLRRRVAAAPRRARVSRHRSPRRFRDDDLPRRFGGDHRDQDHADRRRLDRRHRGHSQDRVR